MPTYTYRREDGSEFDQFQVMSEDPLLMCPETGQHVKRVVTGGIHTHLKGSWPSKTIATENRHAKGLAKDKLYTSLPEYQEKVKQFNEETGRDLKLQGTRVYT
jgi:putative FmdB family regulatory protein